MKTGAVAVSLNALLRTEEARYVLEDSGAAVLFTTAALWEPVASLREVVASLRHVVLCEGESPGETTTLDAVSEGMPAERRARSRSPRATCRSPSTTTRP